MTIIILQSEAGAGKSFACCGWEEPIKYYNLEDGKEDADNRLEQLIARYYPDRKDTIERVHLRQVYETVCTVGKVKKEAYELDGISSIKGFLAEVDKIRNAKTIDFSTVVVDGISDLRDYAHDLWCFEHGRQHAVNPGDWGEVNDIVQQKLQPLVNLAKRRGFHLILTAQYKDNYTKIVKTGKDGKKYEESVKDGRVANYKEWEAYGVNAIIELVAEKDATRRPTGKYFAYCDKSLAGAWSENITNKSLFEVLEAKGV